MSENGRYPVAIPADEWRALLDVAEVAREFDRWPCRGDLATDCLAENAYSPCATCRIAAALHRLEEVRRDR